MEESAFKLQFIERLQLAKQMMLVSNKASLLFIVQIPNKDNHDLLLPITRESISHVICFVEIGNASLVDFIIEQSRGIIDRIILDIDNKRINSTEIINKVRAQKDIPVLEYSDFKMWGDSAVDFIFQNEQEHKQLKVLLLGHSYLTTHILLNLIRHNVSVYMFEEDYLKEYPLDNEVKISIDTDKVRLIRDEKHFHVIIGSNVKHEYDCTRLDMISSSSIYDIGLQNFSCDYINSMIDQEVKVYRFDNRAAVSSVVLNLMETEELINNVMGTVMIGNYRLISGGVMGKKGDIVVDNIQSPYSILGIADGHGAFIHEYDYTDIQRASIIQIKNLIDLK